MKEIDNILKNNKSIIEFPCLVCENIVCLFVFSDVFTGFIVFLSFFGFTKGL